jgi:hypothetical protein
MNVGRLIGRLRLPCCLGAAVLLIVAAAPAQPDRLTRAFLGISSIPVRFAWPADKKCSCLAVAKFKDGKFVGYADMGAHVEPFLAGAGQSYEAELGWGARDGKSGYFLVTPGGSRGFREDDFFAGLGFTSYLALGRAPTQTLGPFSVLGFAMGAGGTPVRDAKPGDVRDLIRGKFPVAVFLIRQFETEEQGRAFGRSLPELSVD